MGNLSQVMSDRLEKWRKNTLANPSLDKLWKESSFRRQSKGDFGDVGSLEEQEEEAKRSQRRK